MSGWTVTAIIAGWLAIGVVLSLVLGRRGHDRYSWFVLGTLLGPLAVALAVGSSHTDERLAVRTIAATSPVPADTAVDALVGYDGSPEAAAAIATVVSLFGTRLHRLTLATVIPFDSGRDSERRAVEALQAEAERIAWLAPGLDILHGHPATALVTHADEAGYDVLAIGTRGAGRAHLFGSVARRLAGTSKVPVLLGGTGAPAS